MRIVATRSPRMTLGDIRRDADRCPRCLLNKAVPLFNRKLLRKGVHGNHQVHALLPDRKVSMRLNLSHPASFANIASAPVTCPL